MILFFFFFKQKTAYEMRISDWSSDVCSSDLLTVTLLDGLVLARSAFHHSMNYRSVMVHGRGVALPPDEKPAALDLFTERVKTGRARQAREIGRASCRERVCQYV